MRSEKAMLATKIAEEIPKYDECKLFYNFLLWYLGGGVSIFNLFYSFQQYYNLSKFV